MKPDEFYIGYGPKMPKRMAQIVGIAVGVFLVVSLATVLVISNSEKGFSNSQFEYGTLTELEGVLYREPVPMLRVFTGKNANGQLLYKSILLINFQKFGAEKLLAIYQNKGVSEAKSTVKLRGTLIYHDGVTLMELTEREEALLEVKKSQNPLRPQTNWGQVALEGEIIDPKCYFGSMKPGESVAHRDCAIRCISGGIPPVLVVKNPKGETNYMLLTDQNGKAINQHILEYVALPINIKGNLVKIDEWFVLKVNPADIVAL